ncbi:ribosomal protein S9/S16-domain-containing protein [Zychaea mexicana]|uniref:ribosomal protein S9/S16-domain-containing protein n=1 Tax=Zychaea mexicana TaxID=64656 RepID=UPI0022FE3942|nr:ribosomal protein S9/S16-domain-containing protein [Zychaea mexicana]KAI9490977.1 ribosomal protein S9/S16-domain-containing protein [Zychaea mexicana]
MSSFLLRRGLLLAAATSKQQLTRSVVSPAAVQTTNVRFATTDSSSSLYEVREKPQSLSYFTGNYKYNDLLIELDALHKTYGEWQGDNATFSEAALNDTSELQQPQQQQTAWKLRDKMSQMLAIPLKTSQWRKIVLHLNALSALPKPLPAPVEEALKPYRRYDGQQQQTTGSTLKALDALGRAYAVGRRKESSARCWVVEGDGQVLINGQPLEEYFQRPVDRDEVNLPLEAIESKDRYNVWALVNGGGSTGQAQAVKLGVGRALLTHNQELKPILRKAGCITRDPRVVERKKEGQRKARARYTWVKR